MLSNFFYYVIYSSAVIVYGIGINKSLIISKNPRLLALDIFKMLITVSATSALSYLIVSKILILSGLIEIYPFVCVLIFCVISVFAESIIRITARISKAEYAVSILIILLCVNESISLAECVLNSCFCVFAFFFFVSILYAVRKRTELSHPTENFRNLSLLLISLAILILLLLAWNVSWLNVGVTK